MVFDCIVSWSLYYKFSYYSSSSTVVVGQQSDDLQGYTSVGSIVEEKSIQGVQHLYKAEVTITKGHGFKKNLAGRRNLCLVASERYYFSQ